MILLDYTIYSILDKRLDPCRTQNSDFRRLLNKAVRKKNGRPYKSYKKVSNRIKRELLSRP